MTKLILITIALTTTILANAAKGNLFNMINGYRKVSGMRMLSYNSQLCKCAYQRAVEVEGDWSHDGFYTNKCLKQFPNRGENLAKNFNSSNAILQAWLNSPTHKEILSNPAYTKGCVGFYGDNVVLEVAE